MPHVFIAVVNAVTGRYLSQTFAEPFGHLVAFRRGEIEVFHCVRQHDGLSDQTQYRVVQNQHFFIISRNQGEGCVKTQCQNGYVIKLSMLARVSIKVVAGCRINVHWTMTDFVFKLVGS